MQEACIFYRVRKNRLSQKFVCHTEQLLCYQIDKVCVQLYIYLFGRRHLFCDRKNRNYSALSAKPKFKSVGLGMLITPCKPSCSSGYDCLIYLSTPYGVELLRSSIEVNTSASSYSSFARGYQRFTPYGVFYKKVSCKKWFHKINCVNIGKPWTGKRDDNITRNLESR